jgi:hypothetical protein
VSMGFSTSTYANVRAVQTGNGMKMASVPSALSTVTEARPRTTALAIAITSSISLRALTVMSVPLTLRATVKVVHL